MLSMAREEVPVLHNFFQTGNSPNDKNQEQQTDNPVKGSPSTEDVGHNLDVTVLDESWTATNSHRRESSPTSIEMGTDAFDGLQLHKKLRVERSDENRKLHGAAKDDLSLTMQPPRLLPSSLQPPPSNLDVLKVVSKHRDCNMPSLPGMFGPSRTSQKGFYPDSIPMSVLRERTTAATLLNLSPADEGSRTGLKGANGGEILNRDVVRDPVLSLGQSKSLSRGISSESTFLASQETMPITRQLTIFYGGQAHVFEDVSFDKAEAIMALAGSTGRSWSTVYSPQPKASIPLSVMEGSLSTHERDMVKSGAKPGSSNYVESSSGFSYEVRNALSSLFHKAHERIGESRPLEHPSQFAKWATDMQTIADYVGKKAEGTPRVSLKAGDLDKEISGFHG